MTTTGGGGRLAPSALVEGELRVAGRLVDASNATLLCTAELDGTRLRCVYKPIAGERPLHDFPDGTLAARERASYLVSEAAGLHLVPPTVLRDGPYGPGMCQLWVDEDEDEDAAGALVEVFEVGEVPTGWRPVVRVELGDGTPAVLVHRDDERLRRVALFDAVVNNADRKGGHLLNAAGRVHAIDHGLTFAVEPKLRTILWGWAGEPLTDAERASVERLDAELASGPLRAELAELLTAEEAAACRLRVGTLLEDGRLPRPGTGWRILPWPLL